MAPKSVSFKTVWDKIMTNKDQAEEANAAVHTPIPLVTKTASVPGLSPSTSNQKRLTIDRPLKISQNVSASDPDPGREPSSSVNGFGVDSIENLLKLQHSDVVTKRLRLSRNDSEPTSLSLSYNLTSSNRIELTDRETPKTFVLSREDESAKTMTRNQSDDMFSGFEFNMDSINTPKTSKITVDYAFRKTGRTKRRLTDADEIVKDIYSDKPTVGRLRVGPTVIKSTEFTSPRIVKEDDLVEPPEPPKELVDDTVSTPERPASTEAKTEEALKDEQKGDEDIIKILVFTDTHLGYKEEDIYRGDDAMNSFEELLYVAKYMDVDLIVHAGDLFDKNIPSRTTM